MKKKELPHNVKRVANQVTKSGRVTPTYDVTCINCGKVRTIKRRNHAVNLSKHPCKSCSNKDNNPQGVHKGIRVSHFNKYKIGAKSRNIDFDLDIDFAAELARRQGMKCALSGLTLIFAGDFNEITASLDRIDSSIGYVKDNVHWVHKDVNMMKGTLSLNRFHELCKLITYKIICQKKNNHSKITSKS